MRSAASWCPVTTAASAHSAAYHGRHIPLYHAAELLRRRVQQPHRLSGAALVQGQQQGIEELAEVDL